MLQTNGSQTPTHSRPIWDFPPEPTQFINPKIHNQHLTVTPSVDIIEWLLNGKGTAYNSPCAVTPVPNHEWIKNVLNLFRAQPVSYKTPSLICSSCFHRRSNISQLLKRVLRRTCNRKSITNYCKHPVASCISIQQVYNGMHHSKHIYIANKQLVKSVAQLYTNRCYFYNVLLRFIRDYIIIVTRRRKPIFYSLSQQNSK